MRVNFFTLFMFCVFLGYGQISTDRPTQSFSPYVMPIGKFQIESGFVSERPQVKVDYYNVTYLNTLMRLGVTEWFELRAVQNYQGQRTLGTSDNGWSATSIGTKVHIKEESGGIPQMAVIGTYSFANGSGIFKSENSVQDVRLLFRNTISDRVTLDYNLGSIWDGEGALGAYTLCLGISATDRLGVFLEPYGFFGKSAPADHRFNTGFTYLITDNFQVDGSVGNGLVPRAPDYFISFGVGILF